MWDRMGLEDVGIWIIQNVWTLAVGAIVGAVLEILFKAFIWDEYVAPSFRYQIKLLKNKIKKRLHNTTVDLSYSSRTMNLEAHRISKENIRTIADVLRAHNIMISERSDILIESYNFRKMKLSGNIELATISTSRGEILQDLGITINAQIRYNSMNDEIPAIIDIYKNILNMY